MWPYFELFTSPELRKKMKPLSSAPGARSMFLPLFIILSIAAGIRDIIFIVILWTFSFFFSTVFVVFRAIMICVVVAFTSIPLSVNWRMSATHWTFTTTVIPPAFLLSLLVIFLLVFFLIFLLSFFVFVHPFRCYSLIPHHCCPVPPLPPLTPRHGQTIP